MLKVGLIGCGGIGAVHARCWLAMSDKVQLVAIADIDTERAQEFAEEVGAKVYADGYEMLQKEALDVADICVPTFLHAPYVIKAAERVKNVIVEKPVCLKEEEAQQLLKVQEETGALIQVAHVGRFSDAYRYLKETVSTGRYGKVIAGRFSRISPRPLWMKGHDEIDRTGTMTVDMHIHDVDFIRYMMEGEPDHMDSWAVRDERGIVQHIWSSYRYGDALLTAEGSWDYPSGLPFTQTFRVRLERAAVVLDEAGVLTVYPEEGGKQVPSLGAREERDLGINVSDLGPYMNEMKYFVKTIEAGDREGIASLAEAVASFRLAKRVLEEA